jgi:hypothetical protein
MLPVAVNVPGDCAMTIEAWWASHKKISESIKTAWKEIQVFLPVGFMSRLLNLSDFDVPGLLKLPERHF